MYVATYVLNFTLPQSIILILSNNVNFGLFWSSASSNYGPWPHCKNYHNKIFIRSHHWADTDYEYNSY